MNSKSVILLIENRIKDIKDNDIYYENTLERYSVIGLLEIVLQDLIADIQRFDHEYPTEEKPLYTPTTGLPREDQYECCICKDNKELGFKCNHC